jgi:hypothetical protein
MWLSATALVVILSVLIVRLMVRHRRRKEKLQMRAHLNRVATTLEPN